MGAPTGFQIAYHLEKIAFFLIFFLPYFEWKTWRAKSAFKNELLRNGLPKELAANLADSYGKGNKSILTSILTQRTSRSQIATNPIGFSWRV